MNKHHIAIIVTFAALIFGLGILPWVTPDAAFSENENRTLQQLPTVTVDSITSGAFGDDVEDYLSDQFFLRDRWTALRSKLKMLLQNKDIGGVYLAEDGYYIEKMTDADVDTERFEKNLGYLKQFFGKIEGTVPAENISFMPIPSPGYVLGDHLPAYATLFDQDAAFDKMAEAAEGFHFVDLREAFVAADEKGKQLFYRTDHHWTSLGALLAYQEYRTSVGETAPAVSDFKVEQYPGFWGTLYSKVLDPNAAVDSVDLYRIAGDDALKVSYNGGEYSSCYDMTKLQQKDMYEVFLGGNWPTVTITGGEENGRHLLVLKDSYANAWLPFAAMDYEQVTAIDLRYYLGSLREFIEQQGITDVLVLYNASGFMADQNLNRLLFGMK